MADLIQLQIVFKYYDWSNMDLMLAVGCNRPKPVVRIESHYPDTNSLAHYLLDYRLPEHPHIVVFKPANT